MARLTISEGGQSSVFELLDDEVTIGRGASSSVQVADDHASKNHAVIRKVGGRAKLVDLDSKILCQRKVLAQMLLLDRIQRLTVDDSDRHDAVGAQSVTETPGSPEEVPRDRSVVDRHHHPVGCRPGPRDPMLAHVLFELVLDLLGGAAERQLAQSVQIAGSEEVRHRSLDPLRRVDQTLFEALPERLG